MIGWGRSGPATAKQKDLVKDMTTLHKAVNTVDVIRDNSLIYHMRRPGDKDVHDLEGIGFFGDSGSPALIENPDTYEWNIGGVKSWGVGYGYGAKAGYARLGGDTTYNWIMENIAFD